MGTGHGSMGRLAGLFLPRGQSNKGGTRGKAFSRRVARGRERLGWEGWEGGDAMGERGCEDEHEHEHEHEEEQEEEEEDEEEDEGALRVGAVEKLGFATEAADFVAELTDLDVGFLDEVDQASEAEGAAMHFGGEFGI